MIDTNKNCKYCFPLVGVLSCLKVIFLFRMYPLIEATINERVADIKTFKLKNSTPIYRRHMSINVLIMPTKQKIKKFICALKKFNNGI